MTEINRRSLLLGLLAGAAAVHLPTGAKQVTDYTFSAANIGQGARRQIYALVATKEGAAPVSVSVGGRPMVRECVERGVTAWRAPYEGGDFELALRLDEPTDQVSVALYSFDPLDRRLDYLGLERA